MRIRTTGAFVQTALLVVALAGASGRWSPAEAGNMITGLDVTVSSTNAVTVHNTGSLDWPGSVGTAGTYGYMNGWSHVSGTVTWKDTNNSTVMTLGSSGVSVLVNGGIANSNGSRSGSVQLGGSSTLGANLRSTYGVGTSSFTSTVATGSVAFTVSGTVTIDVQSPLITGLVLEVASNNAVTVTNTGNSAYPQAVGSVGTYGYMNGWSHVSGTITWKDTNNSTVMTLGSPGVSVLVNGGIANSNGSKSGSVQLAGNTILGAALRNAYGEGTSAFGSVLASGSRDYGVTGTVTVAPLQPDLIVQSPGVGNDFVGEGDVFSASATVKNNGLGSAGSSTLRYLRSNNSLICYTCGVDIQLDTDFVSALGPGATSFESEALTMLENNKSNFTYWIGSCVDDVADESLTGNQCSSGVEVTVPCHKLTARDRTVSSGTTVQACEELTAGPAMTVTTSVGLNLYGGDRVTFVDGFEVGATGKMTAYTCGQSLCEAGEGSTPLDPSCHPCVQQVCDSDPYCCDTDWDTICTGELDDYCSDAFPFMCFAAP